MLKINLPSGPIIHYRQIGAGPPLLLQHGWGGSSLYWQGTAAHLADIRTVYSIDLPGYGQSPPMITDQATPQRLAELIIEFMDSLGLEQIELVGHSFGSNLVSYVAADNPERVPRLVLTCPATYRDNGERRMIKVVHRLMGLTLRLRRPWVGNMPTVYRRFSERFFYRLPKDQIILREGFEDFLRMDRRTATESAISAANEAVNDALQRIMVKTLIIGASNDQIMPRHGPSTVAQLIPGSRLVWIENCGHLPMVERPEVYHWLLRNFLTSGYTSQPIPAATANPVPVISSQASPVSVDIAQPAPEPEPVPASAPAPQSAQRAGEQPPDPARPARPAQPGGRVRPSRITAEHLAQARQTARSRQTVQLRQSNSVDENETEPVSSAAPDRKEQGQEQEQPQPQPQRTSEEMERAAEEAGRAAQVAEQAAQEAELVVKEVRAVVPAPDATTPASSSTHTSASLLLLQQTAEEAANQAREAATQAAAAAQAAYQAAIAARHAEELVAQQAALAGGGRS